MINTIEDIKNFIKDTGFKRVFVLCGKKSFVTSGAEILFKEFYSIKNDKNLIKKIQNFLNDNSLSFLEVKISNSKIKKLPRPTDLIKIKKLFMK